MIREFVWISIHPRKDFAELDSPVWEEMRACAVYELGNLTIQSALCLKDALQAFYKGKGDECRVVHCSSPTSSAPEDCVRSLIRLVDRSIDRTNIMSAYALHAERMTQQKKHVGTVPGRTKAVMGRNRNNNSQQQWPLLRRYKLRMKVIFSRRLPHCYAPGTSGYGPRGGESK